MASAHEVRARGCASPSILVITEHEPELYYVAEEATREDTRVAEPTTAYCTSTFSTTSLSTDPFLPPKASLPMPAENVVLAASIKSRGG